jgi:hypothetical protein
MLRAYLRGLLPKNTPQGFRSRIRENLLLAAIDAEETAAYTVESLRHAASLAGGASMGPGGRRTLLKRFGEELEMAEYRRNMDYRAQKRLRDDTSGSTSAAIYEMLERGGLVGDTPQAEPPAPVPQDDTD